MVNSDDGMLSRRPPRKWHIPRNSDNRDLSAMLSRQLIRILYFDNVPFIDMAIHRYGRNVAR